MYMLHKDGGFTYIQKIYQTKVLYEFSVKIHIRHIVRRGIKLQKLSVCELTSSYLRYWQNMDREWFNTHRQCLHWKSNYNEQICKLSSSYIVHG